MEGKIGNDALLRPLLGPGHLRQRLIQPGEVFGRMMQGGKSGRLDLQRQAQLEQIAEALPVVQIVLGNADRPRLRLRHEGADALPGFHQPLVAQLGNGLTHHRAADAKGLGQSMFRRQPVTGLDPALADVAGDLGRNACRQMFTAPDLFHADGHSLSCLLGDQRLYPETPPKFNWQPGFMMPCGSIAALREVRS